MRNQDGKSSVEEWLVVAELPCVLETSIRRKEQRCNPTIRFLDLTMEHLRWISAAVDVGIVDEIHIVRTDGLHLIELVDVGVPIDADLSVSADRASNPECHVFEQHGKVHGVGAIGTPDDIIASTEDRQVQFAVETTLKGRHRIARQIFMSVCRVQI